jgi:hypothetical protein
VIRRLYDILAPVRPANQDAGYRRALRWAALPVTNRRWAAPLCAVALGFGLFAGVAIGPGATGSLATGPPQIIEVPGLLGNRGEEEGSEAESGAIAESGGGGESEASSIEPAPPYVPSYVEPELPETYEEPSEPHFEPEEEADEPEEEAQVLTGVVVHANPAAGSYTLVETGGALDAVHAAKLPAPGTRVTVPVRVLANGTFAEAGARKQTGKQTQTSFAGIVTFVDADPATPAYTVSKRGVSVLVRIHPDPTGAASALPVLGVYAKVEVEIDKPQPAAEAAPVTAAPPAEVPQPAPTCAPDPANPPPATPKPVAVLWQRRLSADGAPFASSDFEGVVMAVCPAEGQLLLSADDMREAGMDSVFTVPRSIKTAKLKAGDSVEATAAIEEGGGLKLTGLAGDERTKGADDAAAAQGELVTHGPQ